jgi:hypothetical protein
MRLRSFSVLDYQADDVPETPPSPPEVSDSFTSRRVLSTIPGDYHAGLKWCFETFNATAGVNPACIAAHHTGGPATDDPDWLCMFAEHSAAFTHTPIFPLQSQVRCCGCKTASARTAPDRASSFLGLILHVWHLRIAV